MTVFDASVVGVSVSQFAGLLLSGYTWAWVCLGEFAGVGLLLLVVRDWLCVRPACLRLERFVSAAFVSR